MVRHCAPRCGHLHFSTLKHMAKSPAHYLYAAEHGSEATAAMGLGTAAHAMVLEKGDGLLKFDGTRRGKEWDAFRSANPDATILTASEWATAQGMADSLLAHPRAVELLAGNREVPIHWTFAGKTCRGRIDVVRVLPEAPAIVEVKTTSDAHPLRFQRTAERLGYFAQLAWYMHGFASDAVQNPVQPPPYIDGFIVAVESKPPYVVQTFQVTPNALEIGTRQWRSWFERLLVCEASGEWPGYQESDAVLDLPEELALAIDGELLEVA